MLSVSKAAVLFNGDHNLVYVTKDKGLYIPTIVELGEHAENYMVVASGLKEGDEVVTNGTFLIDSETQIKMGAREKSVCPEHQHWDKSMSMCMSDG